ncbi:glycosyltransferase N-terminal domain-containing protein [Leptospira sp. 96542]|nr:glycosyltransferase N-terminal domain-containing protein [Leptospira sp. 96542]
MIFVIYNFIIIILYSIIRMISFFPGPIRREFLKREKSLNTVLQTKINPNKEVIWLHSASVGELDQAKAIATVLKKKNPNIFILQSVFSSSVKENHLNDPVLDLSFFLPFDLPFVYDSIFFNLRPKKLIILAWDTWPNLLRSANKWHTPSYLVCASLNKNSTRNKGFAALLTKKSFSYLAGIYPSHSVLEKEFLPFLSKQTDFAVLGDSRFDSVTLKLETKEPPKSFTDFINKQFESIRKNPPVIFGSTYPVCESYLLEYLTNHPTNDFFWIFPHKWDEDRIRPVMEKISEFGTVSKFSLLKDKDTLEVLPKFLFFDEIGILAFAYRYGKIAYVGGGFHNRIHNTIEPAALGLPILTGPKISNAPEAIVMNELGGIFINKTKNDFVNNLDILLKNENTKKKMGEINRNFVVENKGASEKIYLRVFLNDSH